MNNYCRITRTSFSLISLFVILFFGYIALLYAKPPDDLPGEEITEDQYFDFVTPRDSVVKKVPKTSPESPTWLDRAAKTWDAPPIQEQLAKDENKMLMGMGAVFVPSMSDPSLESEIEIIDSTGDVVTSGETGRKYSLMPGNYYVMLGSGAHKEKIVRPVTIEENEISPLIPNWSGLQIDVVDENNYPFRGEYELARIDRFVPFGRGFGRDPDLGENVRTWIMKPGIYKIFGVGQGYNTLTNFITVRMLPGEFVRYTLVQNDKTMEIKGGGVLQMEAGAEITSNWKYVVDVGGGIDFNYEKDRQDDTVRVNKIDLTLLSSLQLKYKKDPFGWDTRIRLDEGINIARFDASLLQSTTDELRLTSIFTWHIFPWLGPYSRMETITGIIPQRVRAPELAATSNYYFILLDKSLDIAIAPVIDSTSESYRTQPSFSPITLEAGVGANMNLFTTRFFDTRILTGMGITYERYWKEKRTGEKKDIEPYLADTTSPYYSTLKRVVDSANYSILIEKEEDRTDVGPEILLNNLLRLGRIAIVESELKFFAPFDRIDAPDVHWRLLVSWRIFRVITLDYEYKHTLVQAKEEDLKQNESKHRILIRFSYTSR